MNTVDRPRHRRRRHYVDSLLQGSLLRWLVLGEVVLFALALFGLWYGMDAAVEANLYRVHRPAPGLPVLWQQLLWFMPLIIAVNGAAVWWLERRWRRRIAAIVNHLEPLLARIEAGDLRVVPPSSDVPPHPVLAAADAWLQEERARFADVARQVAGLPATLPTDAAETEAILAALRRRLRL